MTSSLPRTLDARTPRMHRWVKVANEQRTIWGDLITMRCEHCGSTYPSGSAVWPCPGREGVSRGG